MVLMVYDDATYHTVTSEMGWSHDQVTDWLCTGPPSLSPEHHKPGNRAVRAHL
jgi:hypothetical protein